MLVTKLLIGLGIVLLLMYCFGLAFRHDLDEMEKTHPRYRKHLKNKYGYKYKSER